MKEILKQDSNIMQKKISVIPILSDKVLSGTKTDFSYTHRRMCGYELFAPGKTTGYSYYI